MKLLTKNADAVRWSISERLESVETLHDLLCIHQELGTIIGEEEEREENYTRLCAERLDSAARTGSNSARS